MSITEAKKYIQELHKRQENPDLWPDFLTGLPDKAAIIKKLAEVYPRLGEYSIAYVRIANIHPYLLKYGPDRHADIIQWAAAILKTSCARCPKCFVGTISTHDFIIMCETTNMIKHLSEANKLFKKRIEAFYAKGDLKSKTTMSFTRNGERIKIGLVKLIGVVVDQPPGFAKSHLIQAMGRVCEAMEATGDEIRLMRGQAAS